MGKKRSRSTVVSKGERHSIARSTVKLVRQDRSEMEKAMNKLKAWQAGKNPWITVPGVQSNMRFVRVRANNLWGDPRRTANIYGGRGENE
jgi:hypothetical protein